MHAFFNCMCICFHYFFPTKSFDSKRFWQNPIIIIVTICQHNIECFHAMVSNSVHVDRFNLGECSEWIESCQARNVCLYFLSQFYCLSSEIATKLKQQCPQTNFLVMISCSSGVDTVKYRIKDSKCLPDAVIHFGASCLCTGKYSSELPILFVSLIKGNYKLSI